MWFWLFFIKALIIFWIYLFTYSIVLSENKQKCYFYRAISTEYFLQEDILPAALSKWQKADSKNVDFYGFSTNSAFQSRLNRKQLTNDREADIIKMMISCQNKRI